MTQATAIDLEAEVKNAIEHNAAMMGQMLATIGCRALLAPDKDDYRIVRIFPGAVVIEVDLMVQWGVTQRVRLPLTGCINQIELNLAEVGKRLERVLANLDELLEHRDLIQAEANKQVSLARRQGIGLRVTAVELATVDPKRADRMGEMDIRYEAAACDMLRSFRDTLSVSSVEETSIEMKTLRAKLLPASGKFKLADAKGAVGFIEARSLTQLQGLSKDLEADLREIARSPEAQCGSQDMFCMRFEWISGTVYSEDYLPDIGEIDPIGLSEISADLRLAEGDLVAFTADGRLLG